MRDKIPLLCLVVFSACCFVVGCATLHKMSADYQSVSGMPEVQGVNNAVTNFFSSLGTVFPGFGGVLSFVAPIMGLVASFFTGVFYCKRKK